MRISDWCSDVCSSDLIAIISMFAGNLLALLQQNVKRLLAYSAIAHLGYLLVAFIAAGAGSVPATGATDGGTGTAQASGTMAAQTGMEAVIFYLVAYFITTLGAFGVLQVLSEQVRTAEQLADARGLMWQRQRLALVFTAMMLEGRGGGKEGYGDG